MIVVGWEDKGRIMIHALYLLWLIKRHVLNKGEFYGIVGNKAHNCIHI